MGGYFADASEVVEGRFDVAVDHVLAGSSLWMTAVVSVVVVAVFIFVGAVATTAADVTARRRSLMRRTRNAQPVPRIIVRHDVHAQHHRQILHSIVHHPQVLGIAVTEEQCLRGIASSDEEGGYFVYLTIAYVVDGWKGSVWKTFVRMVAAGSTRCIHVLRGCSSSGGGGALLGNAMCGIQCGQIALAGIHAHHGAAATSTVMIVSYAIVVVDVFVRLRSVFVARRMGLVGAEW
mmetsp:Transcript_18565/g.38821  ORF Transcript_18565/g.38821 Transcript_18565/m.38821 type:complete len:234 (-) Transcript_18565:555-1256(-)